MTELKTIIGSATIVKGSIQGEGALHVEGQIEGDVSLAGELVVDQGGLVKADIEVESALILGAVLGNIQASKTVKIAAGGRVIGDIKAPRVVLEDGSSFKGGIDMGQFELEQKTAPEPSMAVSAYTPVVPSSAPRSSAPRLSTRPQPRSRVAPSFSSPSASPEAPGKSLAPAPRLPSLGRTKAKKKGF